MTTELNTYKKQEKVALTSLLLDLPGFIVLIVVFIVTGSLVTLIDILDTLSNIICYVFIFLLSKKLQTNLKYKFNYGVARVETLSALSCDSIMIAGLVIVLVSSVKELFEPAEVSDKLLFALIVKVLSVLIDIFTLSKQHKIKKESDSGVNRVAYAGAIKNTAFDIVVLLVYIIGFIFRNTPSIAYINPILCILIALYLGRQSFKRIYENIYELVDATLDENTQMKIIRVMNKYFNSYEQFIAINSHKIDGKYYIDLEVLFNDNEMFENIIKFKKDLEQDLIKELGNCKLSIVIS